MRWPNWTAVSLLAALVFASPGAASAEAPAAEPRQQVMRTLEVPLDGRPLSFSGGRVVAVGAFQGADGHLVEREARQGPTRFWLVGTISNQLDGSERDAFATRRVQEFEPSGANVILPEGARVLQRDAHRHAYLVEVPSAEARVVLPVAAWASRALVTRTEMIRALSGRITVEVLGTAPVAALPPPVAAAPPPAGALAGWGAPCLALIVAALLGLAWRRRRHGALTSLMQRARVATDHIRAESRRLGPAFDDVSARAEDTFASLEKVRRHVVAIDAAHARIKGLEGAEARAERAALSEDRDETVERMEGRVDHLEGVAAKLAAQVAGQARDASLDDTLKALDEDVDVAISADEEARTVVGAVA